MWCEVVSDGERCEVVSAGEWCEVVSAEPAIGLLAPGTKRYHGVLLALFRTVNK